MEEAQKHEEGGKIIMAIRGAKTIGEYVIRKYLEERFEMRCFQLEFTSDCEAILTDNTGDRLVLKYDKESKTVSAM